MASAVSYFVYFGAGLVRSTDSELLPVDSLVGTVKGGAGPMSRYPFVLHLSFAAVSFFVSQRR